MKDRLTKRFTRKLESWEGNAQEVKRKPISPLPQSADEVDAGLSADYPFAVEFPTGDRRVFRGLPVTIGRSEDNDLVLADPTVSGQHARLYYDACLKGVCIYDTRSLNGVFVDDLPISRSLLCDGARIRLGAVVLIFRQLASHSDFVQSEVQIS